MSSTIQINSTIERKGYPFQKIEGEIFIVDPQNRVMHQLNEVGSCIWETLRQKREVKEIINIITDEYDIDEQTVHHDVIQFLNNIREQNLIQVIPNE